MPWIQWGSSKSFSFIFFPRRFVSNQWQCCVDVKNFLQTFGVQMYRAHNSSWAYLRNSFVAVFVWLGIHNSQYAWRYCDMNSSLIADSLFNNHRYHLNGSIERINFVFIVGVAKKKKKKKKIISRKSNIDIRIIWIRKCLNIHYVADFVFDNNFIFDFDFFFAMVRNRHC